MELDKVYYGVKPRSNNSKGNLGDVWVKQDSGEWRDINKFFSLTNNQIMSDVINGYLSNVKPNHHKIY